LFKSKTLFTAQYATAINAPYQRCIHMNIRLFSASTRRLRKDWVYSIQGTDSGNHGILEHSGSCIWKVKKICLFCTVWAVRR